jgi:hypothetical protein
MKYENFERVKTIVEEIDKLKSLLNDMNSYPVIKIMQGNFTVLSISAYPSADKHNFEKFPSYGVTMINSIKEDLQHRIDIANEKLENL